MRENTKKKNAPAYSLGVASSLLVVLTPRLVSYSSTSFSTQPAVSRVGETGRDDNREPRHEAHPGVYQLPHVYGLHLSQ